MSDLVIRKENESYVTLDCDEDLNNKIYNIFSAYMPGYRFNPRFKNHLWDGKLHAYSPITQTLPIGLVRNLINYCNGKNITYKLEDLDDMDDVIDKAEMEKTINTFIDGFDARDYQVNAVYEALTHKKGVLLSCTGSGKSLMIYTFMRYLLQEKNITRMCLIVPSVSLVEQMYSDFKEYGWEDLEDNVEMLYSGQKPTFKKPILISTWQSLEKEGKEFFEPYEAVVVDECIDENTLIKTPSGEIKIKDLNVGDEVITFNEKTKQYEPNKILDVFVNHPSSASAKMLMIELDDGKILKVTENHPIYTTNRGWVPAGDLTINDDIQIIDEEVQTNIDKTYVCKFCNKQFKNQNSVNGHIAFCKLNPNRKERYLKKI